MGLKFTWLYQQTDRTQISERLDKVLATSDWLLCFPLAKLFHLTSSALDHSPISLRLSPKPRKRKVGKVFHFQSMWLKDPRCVEVVHEAWNEGMAKNSNHVLGRCLDRCRSCLEA